MLDKDIFNSEYSFFDLAKSIAKEINKRYINDLLDILDFLIDNDKFIDSNDIIDICIDPEKILIGSISHANKTKYFVNEEFQLVVNEYISPQASVDKYIWYAISIRYYDNSIKLIYPIFYNQFRGLYKLFGNKGKLNFDCGRAIRKVKRNIFT